MPYILVGLFIVLLQHHSILSILLGISHLWFLLAIFERYVFFRLVDFIYTSNRRLYLIILLYAVFFIYMWHPVGETHIKSFFWLAAYFHTGIVLSRIPKEKIPFSRKTLSIFLIVCLVAYAAVVFTFYKRPISLVIALGIIILIFLLLGSVKRNLMKQWIIKLDAASMGIYIIHHILIQEMNTLPIMKDMVVDYYYIYPFAQFIIILTLSYLIVKFLSRYSWSKYIIG